jgi:hypothetical protein
LNVTKKDYVLIAAALKGAFPIPENNTPASAWRLCVDSIALQLSLENPRFNGTRFLEACGVYEVSK